MGNYFYFYFSSRWPAELIEVKKKKKWLHLYQPCSTNCNKEVAPSVFRFCLEYKVKFTLGPFRKFCPLGTSLWI